MMRRSIVALGVGIAGIVCTGGACSSTTTPQQTAKGPVARFKLAGDAAPAYLDVPFPSDAYIANGKIVETIGGIDRFVPRNAQYILHELAKTSGFSRTAMASFLVDDTSKPPTDDGEPAWADVDPSSLPATEDACVSDASAVYLVDLSADPGNARVRCRAAVHDDTQRSSARPTIAVGPGLGVLLEEGHRYAAVLTSRVKDKSGARLKASADFAAPKGAYAQMYQAAIDKVRAALGGALAVDKAEIVAIAPYTTHSSAREMFKLRESLEDMPKPKLAWDAQSMAPMGAVKFAAPVNAQLPAGFTASLDDWLGVASAKLPDNTDDPDLQLPVRAHDKIAAFGTAMFKAANFLVSKPGGYTTLDHATFAHDANGNIVPAPDRPEQPIWVSFAIPTAAMPAGGYPCVIVEHGVGGSRADMFMGLANTFAAKGWIVAAIDSVTFGARAVEARYQVDQRTDYEGAPGAKYKGPDGIADFIDANDQPSVTGSRAEGLALSGNGLNFGAFRDQWREGEIDIAQLARLLASDPDLSPLQTGASAPKIDSKKIAYIGGSQGAIEGSVAAAIEPNIRTWVLNVGGGGLILEGAHAASTNLQLSSGALVAFGITGQYFDESNPLLTLLQSVIEPFDAILYAPYLIKSPGTIKGAQLPPRNVLAIEALYDSSVANEATEAFARAAGYGIVTPNVGANAGVSTMERVKDPTKVADRVPLPMVSPDANQFVHDTPMAGITAALVQVSPASHFMNILQSHSTRNFAIPYTSALSALPPAQRYEFRESYREQQAMVVRFIGDAFDGKVPAITGFKPPVRDYDDDGVVDANDPDPSDPKVK